MNPKRIRRLDTTVLEKLCVAESNELSIKVLAGEKTKELNHVSRNSCFHNPVVDGLLTSNQQKHGARPFRRAFTF